MRVTIINGGTQGLGEAVARRLAARSPTGSDAGCDATVGDGAAAGLVLSGRSADRGEALAAELTSSGTPSIFVHADMGDPSAAQHVVDACATEFGTVDGLVNVAALTSRATLWSDTHEHFDAMMAINVTAPYFLIQAATRLMSSTGAKGSIVNVGSTSGHGGQPRLAAYSISKGALAVMTKNLAYSLMRDGVRVNQVNPGWMDTESEHRVQLSEENAPDDWLVGAEADQPMGRLVKPWEVANMIAFLLSPASGLITGNIIDVDQSVTGAGSPPIPSVDEQLSAGGTHAGAPVTTT